MEIFYKTEKLEKTLTNDRAMFKAYGKLITKVEQRMEQLKEADNLAIINKNPRLKLHRLQGKRQNEWSINIVKNWVITFEIANEPIPILPDGSHDFKNITKVKILPVEDYH